MVRLTGQGGPDQNERRKVVYLPVSNQRKDSFPIIGIMTLRVVDLECFELGQFEPHFARLNG